MLRKPESDTTRGLCITCGEKPQRKKGKRGGQQVYASQCGTCANKRHPRSRPPVTAEMRRSWSNAAYRNHKKDVCERCGFVAEDPCQLDVDHIDGNHSNSASDNLQTLCANCHRLKTKRNGDLANRYS